MIDQADDDSITELGLELLGQGRHYPLVFLLLPKAEWVEQGPPDVLADLLDFGCDFLTLGQYLQPSTKRYLPVVRFVPPEEFADLGRLAKRLGFKKVASGPFVRSSYHAREMAEMF